MQPDIEALLINFLSGEDKKQSQAKYSIDSMPTRRTRNKEMSDFDEEDVITDSNPSSASNDHILSLLQKMSAEMSEWRTEQMDLRKEMDDRFALIISDGKNAASLPFPNCLPTAWQRKGNWYP